MDRVIVKRSGFTLIEIVIVIVIIGVLSTLALPRFFQTIEFARSLEAMNILAEAAHAASRCSIMSGSGINYAPCTSFPALAMDTPGLIPGVHFCFNSPTFDGTVWRIQAERNGLDNTGPGAACDATGAGTGVGDTITLGVNVTSGLVTRVGTGVFSGIQ
jgi:prepilin-type N-terminal cleavage/methylation domain-containing protein